MEERIVDDEFGRGIRLKKTKDGYVDVEDELAPETEEEEVQTAEEEIAVILPDENEDETYSMPVAYSEGDDEDLVDLSPEEAERVRKEKADELRRRKEAYENACNEGKKLLETGSFHAAEIVYERALKLDELATDASVGYWRAKTADFTDPDVLAEEYLEGKMEELESDLGVIATEIIKRDYHDQFEKRYQELCEQESPIWERVERKQVERRAILSQRRTKGFIFFLCALLPLIGSLIATAIVGMKNFSTPDNAYVVPTILCGCIAVVAFLFSLFVTNIFFNACRMYRMNENLASTEDGKAVLDIREYKAVYEGLLLAPRIEEFEENDDEEDLGEMDEMEEAEEADKVETLVEE